MSGVVLKLILTPAPIGLTSLAGRRWGPAVSGWLVGLPFTSGPITLFLALNQGTAFAAAAATGTLAGAISQTFFCVAYGWVALRHGWPAALIGSCLAFGVATVMLQYMRLPLLPLFAVVLAILVAALILSARYSPASPPAARKLPGWDIPLRMVLATMFVLLLTGIAPALGPHLTGLLAPFPLYAAILTIFAHHLEGPGSAVSVLRGLLLGLFAFSAFFLMLAELLDAAGIAVAFAAAITLALVVQGGSLWAMRWHANKRAR